MYVFRPPTKTVMYNRNKTSLFLQLLGIKVCENYYKKFWRLRGKKLLFVNKIQTLFSISI